MSARTVAKTAPVAMYAVALHMLDNDLPAPRTLDAPSAWLNENAVIVHVDPEHADTWLDTMTIDDETTRPSEYLPNREHVTYEGRITTAIGEVRIRLRTIRRTIPLRLVEAPVTGVSS